MGSVMARSPSYFLRSWASTEIRGTNGSKRAANQGGRTWCLCAARGDVDGGSAGSTSEAMPSLRRAPEEARADRSARGAADKKTRICRRQRQILSLPHKRAGDRQRLGRGWLQPRPRLRPRLVPNVARAQARSKRGRGRRRGLTSFQTWARGQSSEKFQEPESRAGYPWSDGAHAACGAAGRAGRRQSRGGGRGPTSPRDAVSRAALLHSCFRRAPLFPGLFLLENFLSACLVCKSAPRDPASLIVAGRRPARR
jgi:hypothetical protein